MRRDNVSWVSEFVLMGLSDDARTQAGLFVLFGATYLLTLLGNGLLLLLIWLDTRLHLPMYFFLGHLAFVDICYTSSGVPQMLTHFLLGKKTISFARCGTQLFFSLALGGTEFVLLSAMACDRYVAVCDPLRYMAVMSPRLCVALAGVSWLVGLANSSVETAVTMHLPTCGHNVLNHVACETLALVRLACVDVTLNQVVIVVSSVVVLLLPCCLVCLSYVHIVTTIMKIHSTQGRRKAFETCASHLTVVSMSYGMALFTYLHPHSRASAEQDKVVVLFYAVVTPMLNPLIYSLRNKDMKACHDHSSGVCVTMPVTWQKPDQRYRPHGVKPPGSPWHSPHAKSAVKRIAGLSACSLGTLGSFIILFYFVFITICSLSVELYSGPRKG